MTATIEELGRGAVNEFTKMLADVATAESWRLHDEARRLETEVLMVFKATVIETRKMSALEDIAAAWREMSEICEEAVSGLSRLVKSRPDANANVYHDRLTALGARSQRFQTLHS